ncbi:MAG: hypothetical protein ABII18_03260 [bacterium]|nr:hypothetical protein [bacterium]MBU1916965.1 hypothetical protein [bacterium]
MEKNIDSKCFDVRTRTRYQTNGEISTKDVDHYFKELPNDEENFELVMIVEDDIGLGDQLTEEELNSMPKMTEENINNFDFLDDKIPDMANELPEEDTEKTE